MNWSVRPFVRILIFFVAGILIAKYIPAVSNINTNIFLIVSLVLLLVAVFLASAKLKHWYNWFTGLVFGVLITITGILITTQKSSGNLELSLSGKQQTYLANIVGNPTETDQAVKAIIVATPVGPDTGQRPKPIKVLCYLSKDSLSVNLKYGDIISFSSKLTVPKGPLNPGEFDYGKYLGQNGIDYTSYINGNSWKLIGYKPANPIIAIAGNIRNTMLGMLKQNGLSGNNYAVAAAVLLGYDDFMENDLKQDYIMAGAMHILCVSGLHVGIIFLVINFLLGFLRNNRRNNILKAILLLISVWAYATITGLSPSVQRASLMITVFIFGNLLNRDRDTYNTLAISALILLLINPQLIFNVGFQLSYVAVIGIVTFHQPIYKLIYFKNPIIDKIWSITVLSFAAQLATFPIATYYFHFFPPWFWLTNLFTFPLSFMIIATGLAFVATSWIPIVSQLTGWLLSGMIFLLNFVVGLVKHLPFPGIDHIHTSMPMVFLLYLLFVLTFIMLTKKKPDMLIPVVMVVAIIFGLVTNHQYNVLNQKKLVVYCINKHSTYDFIDGKHHVLLADSALTNEKGKIDYHLKNSRTQWGIDDISHPIPKNATIVNNMLYTNGNFLFFNDIRIFINDGSKKFHPTKSKLHLDMVIISGKKSTDIKLLLTVFDFKKVVIDSSVPYWKQKKIAEITKKQGISCHDVNTEGALVIDL